MEVSEAMTRHKPSARATVIALLAGMLAAAPCDRVFAGGISLSRVLDTTEIFDEIGAPLSGFSQVSLSSGGLAFFGDRPQPSGRGIYAWIGGQIHLVADLSTPVPGGTGAFVKLDRYPPCIRDGKVIFSGEGNAFQAGVYSWIGGELGVVADTNTQIPGTSETFIVFTEPAFNGSVVLVPGVRPHSSYSGIFWCEPGQPLNTVVNAFDQYPDSTQNFAWFGLPLAGWTTGGIIFQGFTTSGSNGVHQVTATGLQTLVDTSNTDWPHPYMTLVGGQNPVASDGNNILFVCEHIDVIGDEGDGLYALIDGRLTTIADYDTPMPGSAGVFWNLYYGTEGTQASMEGDLVVFRASNGSQDGNPSNGPDMLFVHSLSTGENRRVVGVGDVLDGEVVASLQLSRHAISGTDFAFEVAFQSGVKAVYIGSVAQPCPADLDASGSVDIDDLFDVINGWGLCPSKRICEADLDGSGEVDVDDLFLVINAWGACP